MTFQVPIIRGAGHPCSFTMTGESLGARTISETTIFSRKNPGLMLSKGGIHQCAPLQIW